MPFLRLEICENNDNFFICFLCLICFITKTSNFQIGGDKRHEWSLELSSFSLTLSQEMHDYRGP